MKAGKMFPEQALVSRGLVVAASLARGECLRAQVAMQRKMLPPELGGEEQEPWIVNSEDEKDPIDSGVTTFDVGLYDGIARLALQHLGALNLADATQLGEIRNLLAMMQELCRERLAAQGNGKSIASRGWRLAGNLLSDALKVVAGFDRKSEPCPMGTVVLIELSGDGQPRGTIGRSNVRKRRGDA